jgi:hypothetical protein
MQDGFSQDLAVRIVVRLALGVVMPPVAFVGQEFTEHPALFCTPEFGQKKSKCKELPPQSAGFLEDT